MGSRIYAGIHLDGGEEYTTANTVVSERAVSNALAQSLEHAAELSKTSEVTREVVGASILVDLVLENTSDVASSRGRW